MRVLNCVPAYLIFVYFTGDESVAGLKTPEEWNAGLNVVKKYLGLGNHKLNEYIADVFISLKEMGM
jgi:hypothetical protein